jgi:endoglucanase
VIGPGFWNGIDHLAELELPEGDRNLIVTVHYYLPMEFTHQGAPWSSGTKHLSGIKWGSDAEKRRVEADFKRAQKWAQDQNRPLLLGEFGAYDKGEMAYRAAYTAHVARTAESLGWAWAYWQFDSDFIVYDIDRDQWVEPIHKALIP